MSDVGCRWRLRWNESGGNRKGVGDFSSKGGDLGRGVCGWGFLSRRAPSSLARREREVARVQSRDAGLASQIRRAATSTALNISEANRRSGADRRQRFRIAAGSADETRTGLELALARGYLWEGESEKPSAVIHPVLGMLYSLTR